MGRVRTQLDRRALPCFHQRCILDHKIYSRKIGNKYLLWFVAQTGVLHNNIAERVDAYPLSFWYLDEAYNMVNHMLVVSRCFMPRTTKAAYISTPHLKTFWVIFLGKYRINELRFKFIFIRFMFPSQWCYHNCCLCCLWCELKTKLYEKKCPQWQNNASIFLGIDFFSSRVKLGLSYDSAADTLHTHVKGPNKTVWCIFSRLYQLCLPLW